MSEDFVFRRGLGDELIAELGRLAASRDADGQWWRDVLAHPRLFIAVRDKQLDVYHNGSAIYSVTSENNRLSIKTHFKFLVRQIQAYGTLDHDGLAFRFGKEPLWKTYHPHETLKEIISASKAYGGPEKQGLHNLVRREPRVVDLEVSFRRAENDPEALIADDPVMAQDEENMEVVAEKDKKARQHDRIDAVTLEESEKTISIVFHEAKHFSNAALRSRVGSPAVVGQIERYQEALKRHKAQIVSAYSQLCKDLICLHKMRADAVGPTRPLDLLITRTAEGAPLTVNPFPRLLIFGFDEDQRDGKNWEKHRQKLERVASVLMVGNTSRGGPTTAFRASKVKGDANGKTSNT